MEDDLSARMSHAWQLLLARDFASAESMYRAIIDANPQHAEAIHSLSLVMYQNGRVAEAGNLMRQSIDLAPNVAKYRTNLAALYYALKQFAPGIEQAQAALALEPHDAVTHYNLAMMLRDLDRLEEAIDEFRRATELQPGLAPAYASLAGVLAQVGRHEETVEMLKKAIAIDPGNSRTAGNLLMAMNYLPHISPQEVRRAHEDWAKRYCPPPRRASDFLNDRSPDRVLRVGYFSPDLYEHATASFLEPIFRAHHRENVRLFAYNNSPKFDAVSARLRSLADEWRDIQNLRDDQADRLIRDDRIDILLDVCAHAAGGRLTLFAQRPAPVQFTYLAYPATTGVPAVDYQITDAIVAPPGLTESHFMEALARLPGCFLCFQPPDAAPARDHSSPFARNGYVTFGSFNNFIKISDEMLTLWARILSGAPDSRLMIKSRGANTPTAMKRVLGIFSQEHVAANRIAFVGQTSRPEQLALMNQCDIALDTFPYTGTTTTCEAIWMGLPTITRAGETHVSRVSASILTAAGCSELIATSADDYVNRAISLADDRERLSDYHRTLRAKMSASPLTDASGFARNLEALYREKWRAWLASL